MLKEKTLFAMDLTILMAVEDLAQETGQSTEDLLLSLMASETGRCVYDDSLKLWWDGPDAVVERYKRELGKSSNTPGVSVEIAGRKGA